MRGGRATKVEKAVERTAATFFAAALACSAFALLANSLDQLWLAIVSLGAFVAGFALAATVLRMLGRDTAQFALPSFELSPLDLDPWDELLLTEQTELVLTEADRLPEKSAEDELILDDILAKLGSDSRVVRLFERSAMPTPGQLNARIEDHLRQASAPAAPVADASEALFEALTQLRRSLR